ncbi:HAMP domain-containing sensor histidine kinase [Sorangium sp. So ce375]|uniref:sensor histidine kinase n=1 Tax=Sorangium sp. So ce375 TaxID=3133306 RepID=UPI003F5B4940
MSRSLADALVAGAVTVVLGALAGVGVGTAALLHEAEVRALDRALLAAAHEHAHPEAPGAWEVEHSRSPASVWVSRQSDPRVPAALAREALAAERPTAGDVGDLRLLVLPAEVEAERDGHGDHVLIAAAAPRVTLARSVGPFAAIYGALAAAAALTAALLLRRTVGRALAPLDRACVEAARVTALAGGDRLTEEGPSELRALLAAVNALLDRLDAAHRAQVRFTADAAHELRTPVTAMLGEIDVALRRSRGAEEYREVLESVREEVDRLRGLVEGLLALARVDAGQVEQGLEPAGAVALAEEAAARERPGLVRAGCALELDVQGDADLRVHPALVEAAIANLLRNAAAYAAGAPVTLRVAPEPDRVVFQVDDRGPGVPPGERDAVFDRFTRTGEGRRRNRAGLGLGLPLAREVARRHGGECWIEAAPGGGCRAVLTLRRPAAGLGAPAPSETAPVAFGPGPRP